jgi:hypothetical protein
MVSTLEGNSQEKDDSIAQEEEENVGWPLKPAQQGITPEKSLSEDEMTVKSNENVSGGSWCYKQNKSNWWIPNSK